MLQPKDRIEVNARIAQFMGHLNDTVEVDKLQYVHSWDALMPVVHKIEMLWNPLSDTCMYDEHVLSAFKITTSEIYIYTNGSKEGKDFGFKYTYEIDTRSNVVEEMKRLATWYVVDEFLIWYYKNI
jgi:hypothetical protein